MTALVKLDDCYINPEYIKCLRNVDKYFGNKVTFLSLETIDESDSVIVINQPIEEVIEKLQKVEKLKVIE